MSTRVLLAGFVFASVASLSQWAAFVGWFDALPHVLVVSPHLALLDLVKGVNVALLLRRVQPHCARLSALFATALVRVAGGSLQASMLATVWPWLHSPVAVPSIVVAWASAELLQPLLRRSDVGLVLSVWGAIAAAHTLSTSAIDVVLLASDPRLRALPIAPIAVAVAATCGGRLVGDALGLTAAAPGTVVWLPVLRVIAVSMLYLLLVRAEVPGARVVAAAAMLAFLVLDVTPAPAPAKKPETTKKAKQN